MESCSSPDELHSQSTGSPSHTHDCVQDWMKRSCRSSAQSHSPAVCRPQRIQRDSRSPAELSSRPDGGKLPAPPHTVSLQTTAPDRHEEPERNLRRSYDALLKYCKFEKQLYISITLYITIKAEINKNTYQSR